MALRNKTAVGNRVDERFKVIPNGVKTDCKPEISGPAHSEAEEETDKARREPSHPVLAGIVEVNRAKSQGKHNCGGPKANPGRKRIKRIPSEKELLKKTDHEKCQGPDRCKVKSSPPTMQRRPAEIESSIEPDEEQQQRKRRPAPNSSKPELSLESGAPGQTVNRKRTVFERRHHARGPQRRDQRQAVALRERKRSEVMRGNPNKATSHKRENGRSSDENRKENQQTPAGAEFRGIEENA